MTEPCGTEVHEYLTKDGLIFRTIVDIGKVNPKDYTLELLQMAETRVMRGTNRTLETAINSIRSLKRGKKVTMEGKSRFEFDEYGLNEALYTPQQIKFIKETIENYYDGYDISTPYQKSGIIRLAKLECNINELEASIAKKKDKEDINNLKMLTDMHSKLSDNLKLTTKQADGGEKDEDAFAKACIAFEERFRNATFEFENIEIKDKMSEIMIENAPIIMKLIDESPTFYHFKKALAGKAGLKPADVDEIGYFTIEELFEFKKINEDRAMINNKNENTIDPNFVDHESNLDE